MKSFSQFLVEGISQILYHHTSVSKLVSILKDDKFRLASDLGTESDQMYKGKKFKPFYFSTSRGKYGGYARSFGDGEQVNLVLDGEKLSNNLEGKSVSYWGPSFQKPTMSVDMRLRNNELEDRIFSPKSTIDDASEYIKEIHIMMDEKYLLINGNYEKFKTLPDGVQMEAFERGHKYSEIRDYASVYHIPVYFYDNFDAFKLLNKAKTKKGYDKSQDRIESYVELFAKSDKKELSKEADELRYDLLYHNWGSDNITLLNNEIHNYKGDSIKSMSVDKLVQYMHKNKLRNTKEVISFLANKWKPND